MGKKIPFKSRNTPIALLHPHELGFWIGQRLARHRLAANLTREELAHRAGVSPETIKVLETRGRSSLATLSRVVASLGLQDRLEAFLALPEPPNLSTLAARENLAQRKRARKKKFE